MEYRQLGSSGLKVPVLSFGTGTFGGKGDFFAAWGATDAAGARRLVDLCLEAGVTMFDSADVYSDGLAEEILGKAIAGRRDKVLISTKATFRRGDGPNDVGSSPGWTGRCGGSAQTTSTCTSSTALTQRRRWKRP